MKFLRHNFKNEQYSGVRMDWRDSQRLFKREIAGRKRTRRFVGLVMLSLMVWGIARFAAIALYASDYDFSKNQPEGQVAEDVISPAGNDSPPENSELLAKRDLPAKKEMLNKRELQAAIADERFTNLINQSFDTALGGKSVRVETSLDLPLQQFLVDQVSDSISQNTGIVVLEPATGRILAMVSFDKRHTGKNPCVDNSFPAASVIKIITAGAAIETCGFDPNKELTFNGPKWTLYKTQITDRVTRHTNRISFKDSFAQSINPVFGKIGSLRLGSRVLTQYATAFGFNHRINFELELSPSEISVENDPFRLAEIASGYNRDTTLSPVHGALIAAAILNQGGMPEPSIVDRVLDQRGAVLYENRPSSIGKTMSSGACHTVYQLMEGTVLSGTGKKAFRGFEKDRVLSKLRIGGKTGSMDNRARDARIDWFVGFAEEKNGTGALAFAVVVAHEKLIGTRAGQYARMAIEHYFRNHISTLRATQADAKG
jgi:cell division protein FtsI/penicillin-binding protein 2